MYSEESKELAKLIVTQQTYLDVEQRLVIMLHKFSNHLQTKTKEQLLDMRIGLMEHSDEQYLDKETVKLCLQMIELVDGNLEN